MEPGRLGNERPGTGDRRQAIGGRAVGEAGGPRRPRAGRPAATWAATWRLLARYLAYRVPVIIAYTMMLSV